MPSLIAYRKAIDAITTHTLRLPQPEPGQQAGQAAQEIATLADGRSIVVLFDGHTLPTDQPAQIADSIEVLPSPLPDALRTAICEASPHVRLINARVVQAIRDRYTVDDEIKCLRLAPSPETVACNAHVEACRAWGRAQKTALGLSA